MTDTAPVWLLVGVLIGLVLPRLTSEQERVVLAVGCFVGFWGWLVWTTIGDYNRCSFLYSFMGGIFLPTDLPSGVEYDELWKGFARSLGIGCNCWVFFYSLATLLQYTCQKAVKELIHVLSNGS